MRQPSPHTKKSHVDSASFDLKLNRRVRYYRTVTCPSCCKETEFDTDCPFKAEPVKDFNCEECYVSLVCIDEVVYIQNEYYGQGDAEEPNPVPSKDSPEAKGWWALIDDHIRGGSKLQAIKVYRDMTHESLYDSKNAVEARMKVLGL